MKNQEENMEDVLKELAAIIETSKDNIVVTDGKGRVLRVSNNCQEIYGVDPEELYGKSVNELEKRQIFNPSVTIQVLNKKSKQEIIQHTRTGRVVMATGYPVFNEKKQVTRVISYSHDMTEIMALKEKYEQLTEQVKRYESELEELREKETRIPGFIAESPQMQRVIALLQRVAKVDTTVLLLGESGVGKNVIAKAIHRKSKRKVNSFIEINCGAIPEGLLESELFGYTSGSFTGANKGGKPGIIELADKGTLFLDEIGEMPLALQAKLLKVIQEKKITPVGGTKAKTVDFRLIAATNRDLAEMVREGKFRQDLYFRLNVVPIEVPSLRERKEDILPLIQIFLEKFSEKYGLAKRLEESAIDAFLRYDWPGNVREVENVIERLVVTTDEPFISLHHLPEALRGDIEIAEATKLIGSYKLKDILEDVEEKVILQAYQKYGTTHEMAKHLGISQPSVVRRLQKYRGKRNNRTSSGIDS
ncbi:sigma-54 interaction domain-containing protein [Aneurinibacillus aneurinilyticus]|uniref:HTH-type transcriptional regulatory protein TyrR n=1 Tax=Aneurinibacillus aneurinilyticus TaxID=1391 RepID=A0A848CXI8_ANEAE|nr:sigma 54-interacting transcriptional regulator [Aneurinibacillus aneurinilyticus]MED0671294.1 sigma 54-interacting transcriptional regulator [Aneurinibacillus aneurinilyticus]NME98252.1 sigma 54-interacting transcriptional regulator [Aneurinibacillus aneurinilyticus]